MLFTKGNVHSNTKLYLQNYMLILKHYNNLRPKYRLEFEGATALF